MKTVISLVVDDHPKFLMQAWNLVLSLVDTGTVPQAGVELIVHHTSQVDRQRLRTLEALGARLVSIEPFGEGNAVYCNKLRQLETEAVFAADLAILLDADTIAMAPLTGLISTDNVVRAKVVDGPNPPTQIWQALFAEAGFDVATLAQSRPSFFPEERTLTLNCNGGLYVLPKKALQQLRTAWPIWSRFCLENSKLLDRWAHHADQLGFALAMTETSLDFEPLDIADNFPTHFPLDAYRQMPESNLRLIHYHSRMDNHGLPMPVGVAWIDMQIKAMNERLRQRRRGSFDNQLFWDFRYKHDEALGSGVGSRGDVLAYKQARLAPYLRQFSDRPVVDVGCGDLETLRYAPLNHVLGLELSPEALEIARAKRPDWQFRSADVADLPDASAALVVCLDVLIHQHSDEEVRNLIGHLLRVATDMVIVSGYEETPAQSDIIFYHGPLSKMLEAYPDVERVFQIAHYRDVTMFVAEKRPQQKRNRHDIDHEGLAWGMANCPTPALLLELVQQSRDVLGFYPQTIVRTLEYPWLASRMRDSAGLRAVDVGAGLSILPSWLAERGAFVTTVDNSQLIRSDADRGNWNEWGYLDFSRIDAQMTSLNQDFLDLKDEAGFDVIYSISVIEHMPAAVRRQAIVHMKRLIRAGGRLLLTLDLVPDTNELWPLAAGVVVDLKEPHGDLAAIIAELEGAGFMIFEQTVVRRIPSSRTDLVMIDARLRDDAGRHQPH